MEAERRGAPVADDVVAQFAARGLDTPVGLADGRAEGERGDGLPSRLHCGGAEPLVDGPGRHHVERLLDDVQALAQLGDADDEAVVDVAVGADRDVEVELIVGGVRIGLAHVPGDTAGAQHRAADGVGHRLPRREDTDAARAGDDDLVVEPPGCVFGEALRQVLEQLLRPRPPPLPRSSKRARQQVFCNDYDCVEWSVQYGVNKSPDFVYLALRRYERNGFLVLFLIGLIGFAREGMLGVRFTCISRYDATDATDYVVFISGWA